MSTVKPYCRHTWRGWSCAEADVPNTDLALFASLLLAILRAEVEALQGSDEGAKAGVTIGILPLHNVPRL